MKTIKQRSPISSAIKTKKLNILLPNFENPTINEIDWPEIMGDRRQRDLERKIEIGTDHTLESLLVRLLSGPRPSASKWGQPGCLYYCIIIFFATTWGYFLNTKSNSISRSTYNNNNNIKLGYYFYHPLSKCWKYLTDA